MHTGWAGKSIAGHDIVIYSGGISVSIAILENSREAVIGHKIVRYLQGLDIYLGNPVDSKVIV